MRILTGDLAVVTGLAAAVVVSLAAVRVTASAPEPTTSPAPATTGDATPWPDITAPISTPPSPVLSPTGPGPTKTTTTQAPRQQQPVGTLVLSSGAAVNPRLDRTPRTPRPAATPTMIVAPTPPPDSPDPQVFLDERLRERFIGLARSVLADAAAAARSAGTTTEPTLLWLDLKDETGMIRYLDAFRDQLGVSRGPLLRPADDDGRLLNDVEWSRRKYGYGDKLKALATEIKKLALAVASMETSHVD